MTARDRAAAVGAATAWGLGFVVIRLGLDDVPPLLFAALRFTLVALPWVFLVPAPDIPLRWIVLIGITLGIGQFGLLYIAIDDGMPAGIASVVLQAQVPITIVAGLVLLGEYIKLAAAAGVAVSVLGLVLIGIERGAAGAAGFALVLGAALCFATSNIALRQVRPTRPASLIVWSSLASPPVLLALSLIFEGPAAVGDALARIGPGAVAATLYLALVATLGAFIAWSALLRRYPAHAVAPYALLIPVVGLLGSWIVLGERPAALELAGSALIIVGLMVATADLRQLRGRRALPRLPASGGGSGEVAED